MQRFVYRALTPNGDTVRGLMEAARTVDVAEALRTRSLRVVTIRRRRRGFTIWELFPEVFHVPQQQIGLFCRQLATFVRVGVPVTMAMRTISEQTDNPLLRAACATMVGDLEHGASLSEAMSPHRGVFPPLVVDMVRSAEFTGNLDGVLRQAARHIEREASARRKVRAAMTYPLIVASMALVIAVGMVIFVLPQFRALFASFHLPLPGLVSFVLAASDLMRGHAVVILVGLLVAVLIGGRLARSAAGRLGRDRVLLRLPLVGGAARAAVVERFCRTLGDMLEAGVPITQTFPLVVESTRNLVYKRSLRGVAAAMASGEGFTGPLQRTGLFPAVVLQMVRVGEETGTLDRHLSEAADLYGEELDYRLKRMTNAIEPALIIAVACIVGFLAITMVLAIYSLAGQLK